MDITLIGYGRMGHIIETIARKRGHRIVLTIDRGQEELFESEHFLHSDVAIEFSTPQTALRNIEYCFGHHIPVVSGTTGDWTAQLPGFKKRCEEEGQTLFWASNFSIGMNLFFALNKHLAKLMKDFPVYSPSLIETHHIHKLDAPSGTAITLAEQIVKASPSVRDWQPVKENTPIAPDSLPVSSIREGEVPGIHTINYRSDADCISITHEAFGREGFALGAVLAAEFTASHKGFLNMQQLLNLKTDE